MVKFSLYPPLMNESCKVQCHDERGTYTYEMRGDPAFTDEELEDIQPDVRKLFQEWLTGAQERFREADVLKGGLYGAESDDRDSTIRDRERDRHP
jgi:hypothetical protein